MKSARNHQMQDQPQFICKAEADSFAQPAQPQDLLAFDCRDGRRGGAHKKD